MVTLSWRWARSLEALFSTRRLQPQLRLLVCVAFAAALWPLYLRGLAPGRLALSDVDPAFALVWLVGIVCAVGAAYLAKYHRLAALILLGGAGLVTCITFVWMSAPDLALTQILVETLVVILLVFSLPWLSDGLKDAPKPPAGTALFATAAGALAMLLVLKASVLPSIGGSVSQYHLEHSLPAAKGGNATLTFASKPDSMVIFDGRPLGKTPKSATVPPGQHTVVFVHPEHGRKAKTVNVTAGQKATLTVKFP